MATITETIPKANLAPLQERLAKLNKRASKLSVAPVALSEGPSTVKAFPADAAHPAGYSVEYVEVTVTGETPKLAGWRLAAVRDLSLGEPLFNRVPGEEANLDAYKASDATACEHCRVSRHRIATFVLVNDDGRVTQVGRDCLVDFLGGQDPANLVACASFILEWGAAVEDAREFDPNRTGGDRGVETLSFLAATAACVRVLGWTSRTVAEEKNRTATVNEVWSVLFPPLQRSTETQKFLDSVKPTEADKADASATLAWARAIDPVHEVNEYLNNLGRACRSEFVTSKHGGLVASAVASWKRAVGRAEELKRLASTSTFVGEVGKRLKWTKKAEGLTLTLLGAQTWESDWGTTHFYKFADAAGNLLVWFASSTAYEPTPDGVHRDEIKVGSTHKVDASVKRHEERNGVKQTTLTRVVVKEVA
jgi:hypothetical protein